MEDSAVRFISDYLANRKQKRKLATTTVLGEMFFLDQGSILGSPLFNIYLYDLFLLVCNIDVASDTDDTTPHVTGDNLESVIKQLEQPQIKGLSLERKSVCKYRYYTDNQ